MRIESKEIIYIRQIEELKKRRLENEKAIKEVLEFLGGPGKMRRIRPCDIDDPLEIECPAGNRLKDESI